MVCLQFSCGVKKDCAGMETRPAEDGVRMGTRSAGMGWGFGQCCWNGVGWGRTVVSVQLSTLDLF